MNITRMLREDVLKILTVR